MKPVEDHSLHSMQQLPIETLSFKGNEYHFLQHEEFYYKGENESKEKFWNIKPGDIVVDVGAFVGTWTLPALACGALVYAFEPGTMGEILKQNAALNPGFFRRLIVERDLVYKERREDMSYDNWEMKEGGGRFITITLDDYFKTLDRIDLVKVDIEGFELEALQGARELLKRCHPRVLVEAHTHLGKKIEPIAEFMMQSDLSYQMEVFDIGQDKHLFFS